MTRPNCLICGAAHTSCGPDHVTSLVSSDTIRGVPVAEGPQELKQYDYYVGHVLITAQLTEDQAERLGAAPVGKATPPTEGEVPNREAERMASNMAAADADGVVGEDPEALDKARKTRNRRAH